MKISGISETDNPFTMMGLFTAIIEDIARLEKRISSLENILEMNYAVDQDSTHYLRRMLKEQAERRREIDNL
jgi:hypothetical protein